MNILQNVAKFLQKHIKSHKQKHVLEAVEGKDLGAKFFLGMVLGVMEGQIRGGYLLDSNFDPSAIDRKLQFMMLSQ